MDWTKIFLKHKKTKCPNCEMFFDSIIKLIPTGQPDPTSLPSSSFKLNYEEIALTYLVDLKSPKITQMIDKNMV
jgi:hypothetical protein